METLAQIQGFLIGMIGWAATVMLTLGSSKLNAAEQRAMIVFSWTLWMIPALGALVYRNLIDINAAAFLCGGTTLILALLVSISAIHWRPKH